MISNLGSVVSRLPASVKPAVSEALRDATWMKVRRALAALAAGSAEEQGTEATVQILSSYNLEPIEPAIQLGLRCIPCRPTVVMSPLDTIEQEIFNPSSSIYRGKNVATVIVWRAEELLPGLFFPLSTAKPGDRAGELIARINSVVHAFLQTGLGRLFVSTLPLPTACGGVILDSQLAGGLAATIAEVNAAIHRLGLNESRVSVLDLHRWAAAEGAGSLDLQMEFMARQPFTTRAAISFGFFLARNIRPLLVPRRKVLVLDLDNTLWGGILGEDGVENLKLNRDFPGSVFLRLQKEILELKHQGVLLVLASKNDEADARASIAKLPDMILKWEDFVCHKINFNAKYLNLREAARELGLGLDSFVLLDDSDFEREQMRQFNPEVAVLNEKSDGLHLLESVLRTDLFDTHQVSDEDRKRHHEYELRSARTSKPQENLEDFLKSLELVARVEKVGSGNLERVVQLLGKTNQFNVTTRRHALDEVRRMSALPKSVCLTLRLVDKFGDQGIVGVLLSVPDPTDATSILVDSFLISCRALGRGVEEVLWSEMTTRASAFGLKAANAEYIPTVKNGVVADLFDRLGLGSTAESPTAKKYRLENLKPVAPPAWIKVERINA